MRVFLGEGMFGRVYRAFDPSLKREVALKLAKPEQLGSATRVQRFLREARAAAVLQHPHIVAVFDSGQDGLYHYIASAFVPGRSLDRVLEDMAAQGETLPVRQAAEVVRRLAEALGYAHSRGVVHRDVKPANVLLDETGTPLLADFGLAARADESERLTEDGKTLGTPEFMAPEQWEGKATAASDQYALGCLLYELLTGRLPFAGKGPGHLMALHLHQAPPPPRTLRPELPRDLETICLKCLEKEPQRRYTSCSELADDLRRFLDGELILARRTGPLERVAKWARRSPAVAGLTAAVMLTLLLGASTACIWAGRHGKKQGGRRPRRRRRARGSRRRRRRWRRWRRRWRWGCCDRWGTRRTRR